MNTVNSNMSLDETEASPDTQNKLGVPSAFKAMTAVAGVAAATLTTEQAQAAVTIGSTSKPNVHDAWRFLTQATFGPTRADLAATATLRNKGYVAWLDEQFLRRPASSTFDLTKSKEGGWKLYNGEPISMLNYGHQTMFTSAMWEQFLSGKDQLRQRVAFALSEILVVSIIHPELGQSVLRVAAYHDLLLKNAFGSFLTLIEDIARSNAMGDYLTHIRNERPAFESYLDPATNTMKYRMTRIPDQNFARELMQLFTIGLAQLNIDGTPKLNASGKIIPTYTPRDIQILSFVFTGWGFWSAGPGAMINGKEEGGFYEGGNIRDHNSDSWTYMQRPMVAYDTTNPYFNPNSYKYNQRHAQPEDFEKAFGTRNPVFLGETLVTTGECLKDMRNALAIIFKQESLAPFISKQMIQRLVTSNPSPRYVQRVAQQFKSSNFSLKTLVKAILLDTEARDVTTINRSTTYGKLREPILRMTAMLRALTHRTRNHPVTGKPLYSIGVTQATYSRWGVDRLGQGPYQAASVFNFFRPGYVAPGSHSAERGLVAPELQSSSSIEITAYINTVATTLYYGGLGSINTENLADLPADLPSGYLIDYNNGIDNSTPWGQLPPGIEHNTLVHHPFANRYGKQGIEIDYRDELTLLQSVGVNEYVNDLSFRFFGGQMSTQLNAKLVEVLSAAVPTDEAWYSVADFKYQSILVALFSVLISAEFVVQK